MSSATFDVRDKGSGVWHIACMFECGDPMDPLRKSTDEIINSFSDISVTIEAQFEERLMDLREVLAIQPGSVIPLNRAAGETLRVYVGNVFLASAEVIVIKDHLALRITEFEFGS